MLFDPFKDFDFDSPHPKVCWLFGSFWLIKGYVDDDF